MSQHNLPSDQNATSQSPANSETKSTPTEKKTDNQAALTRRRFLVAGSVGLGGALLALQTDWLWPHHSEAAAQTALDAVFNRAPLVDIPFSALPLGSVKARGWLLTQLELQRDGLTGHAEEILPAAKGDSAWLGGGGENWEKGPYYVKGLVPLAYTLDDADLKAKAQKWVGAMVASSRPDGNFGPANNDDWWPRMVATYLMRDYAEATKDEKVVPVLLAYYKYMAANLPQRPLRDWGKARAGDEIDTIFWLYNRTGESFLLDLADTLRTQAYDWTDIMSHNRFLDFDRDFHTKHNVNVPQAMKMPAVYFQRSKKDEDRNAFALGDAHLMADHGMAFGMSSGTEFLSGRSTTQGTELCSIVERMLSDETVLRILGDAQIGDNIEMLAFNALPAALTKAIRQHVYYTLPNNVIAQRGAQGYNQDYDNGRTPAPISGFPCCCYNFHMGWPKLTQNSWAATREKGLAALVYVPSQVTTKVANGTEVTITEDTNYPFEEEIRFQITAAQPVQFPLQLRIPAWCANATITINGKAQPKPKSGTFASIDRQWKSGDTVVVRLPMTVQTTTGVNNSMMVHRGPLLYTLRIGEEWKSLDAGPKPGFDALEVRPTTPWNYALVVNPQKPASSFTFASRPTPKNPFEPNAVPATLTAKARKVDSWKLAWNGHVTFDPPVSPVATAAPEETVTLVPFGSQMLRVTNFPVVGTPVAPARNFEDNFANDSSQNWIYYGGGWQVKERALRPVSNAGSGAVRGVRAVVPHTNFTDFTYEASVSCGDTGNAGLVFRCSNNGIGADAYSGYYIGISPERKEIELGKANNKWQSLKAAPFTFEADKAYKVQVKAQGSQISISVDGTPVMQVTDDTFASGSIGVRQYCEDTARIRAAFTDIKVRAI